MKTFLFCLLLGCANAASGQTAYEFVSSRFQLFYNNQTTDSIYALFGPTLREKLTAEKTNAVFTGLHVQYGDLKSLVLLKEDNGFNSYKASFKDQILTMLLALDEQHQIEGIRFVPFTPPKPSAK